MPLIAQDLETLCDDDFQAKMLKHPLRKAHYEQLSKVLTHLLKKHTYSSGKDIGQLTPAGNALLSGFQGPARGDSNFTARMKESMLDQLKQEVKQGILLHMPTVELELADTDFNEYEYVGYQKRDGKHFILAVRLTDIVITYETVLGFLKAKVKSKTASEARRQQERMQQDKESAELMQELGLEDETSGINEVSKQEVEDLLHHQADENSTKDTAPTAAQWALFYIYRQQAREIPWFDGGKTTKEAAIKDVFTKNHGNGWKNFRIHYYYQENDQNRVAPKTIANIEKAIKMLEGHPKAQKIAQDELKLAHDKS